jgi:hypothetical protein
MSHWRINGVPSCQSPYLGSKFSKLENEHGARLYTSDFPHQFRCACTREQAEEMGEALKKLYPDEDLEVRFEEESCPGEYYWAEVRKEKRIKALNEWLLHELGGKWAVIAAESTEDFFTITGPVNPVQHNTEYHELFILWHPEQGWVIVEPTTVVDVDTMPKLSAIGPY